MKDVINRVVRQQESVLPKGDVAMLRRLFFPSVKSNIAEGVQQAIIKKIHALFEKHGALAPHSVDELYGKFSENDRSLFQKLMDYLKEAGYVFETEKTDVLENYALRLLETNRQTAEKDLSNYSILGDLGEGVSQAYYYHNPIKPGDWGSGTNDCIMKVYRKKLPDALKKQGMNISEADLSYLSSLPFNGNEASQLIKYAVDLWNKGQRTGFRALLQNFAKEKNWWKASRNFDVEYEQMRERIKMQMELQIYKN